MKQKEKHEEPNKASGPRAKIGNEFYSWSWVQELWDPVENEVNLVGGNLARGVFAEILVGTMKSSDGINLCGEKKVVFKKFLHNPIVQSGDIQMASNFANEIALLHTIHKRKKPFHFQHLGTMDAVVKTEAGEVYTVQPYYDMGNLREFLNCARYWTDSMRRNWPRQLCNMGDELKRLGIVHRDIRPSNICLRRDPEQSVPRLVLVDWKTGWQKARKKYIGELSCLREDDVYQPPEIGLAQEEGPTPTWHQDAWSLAVIIEEMVTGQPSLFSGWWWKGEPTTLAQRFVWMLNVPSKTINLPGGVCEAVSTVSPRKHSELKL